MTRVTPPVLLDAPTSASLSGAQSGSAPPADPALAAEFAAALDQAMPVSPGLPYCPPPDPPPTLSIDVAGAALGEGDGETARSVDPTDILDSATAKDNTVADLAIPPNVLGQVPLAFAVITDANRPAQDLAGSAPSKIGSGMPIANLRFGKGKGDQAIREGFGEKGVHAMREASHVQGEVLISGGVSEASSETAGPNQHLIDLNPVGVIKLDGDRGQFGNDSDDSDQAKSGDGEPMLGEAAHLVGDRPDGIDATRTERIEARPLDRSERARIVHEVIDRVSKHIETLAITRSKEPLTIRLEPADLGRIVVEVSRDAGTLSADLSASDPRVAEALDRHRGELVAGFATRGHAEARVTVQASTSAETPGFNLNRDQGQTPQHPQHSPTSRGATVHDSSTNLTRAVQTSRARVRTSGLDLEI